MIIKDFYFIFYKKFLAAFDECGIEYTKKKPINLGGKRLGRARASVKFDRLKTPMGAGREIIELLCALRYVYLKPQRSTLVFSDFASRLAAILHRDPNTVRHFRTRRIRWRARDLPRPLARQPEKFR
ncbi:hypothetical protein PUN28_017483 [Cardiocondyla obscurior]|uniref:Uncharacterized protein n=1 Tax=Cardiocondyla obscurior TaxID=286306 RepID=A0AAW2EK79_9HYME